MGGLHKKQDRFGITTSLATLVAIIFIGNSPSVYAGTGITFTDIADSPGTGINYERVPSAINEVLDDFKQKPLLLDFSDPSTLLNLAKLPGETRGFPGVAVMDRAEITVCFQIKSSSM